MWEQTLSLTKKTVWITIIRTVFFVSCPLGIKKPSPFCSGLGLSFHYFSLNISMFQWENFSFALQVWI